MIRLDNISKQHGHQILFIDASMGIQKGEKVGLVGPNGAGKTTLFRMDGAGDMDGIVERYGEVQRRFEEPDGHAGAGPAPPSRTRAR
jgi:ATPase subunit of ABC transporter with duplicated ATPase domains